MAYHALGRGAESDSLLDRAAQVNDPGLSLLAVPIQFEDILGDPRWLPFLESIGKSPEQLAAIEFEVKLPQ